MRQTFPIELRAAESGPELHGVILQEGRAATGGRAEVFTPGSATWPQDGVEIRAEHGGPAQAVAFPVRLDDGRIEIRAAASQPIQDAVKAGKRFMSVEFHALQEQRTRGGVREIQRALLTGAALVSTPEYNQTKAEVRQARRYYL